MTRRVSLNDREGTKKKDDFFKNTSKELVSKVKKEKSLKRQTYYLTDEIIKALALMSAYEGKDKSVIVRQMLLNGIPDKYLNDAKKALKIK